MDFQDRLSDDQKRLSLQIWEAFDAKYREMGFDTSKPEDRKRVTQIL